MNARHMPLLARSVIVAAASVASAATPSDRNDAAGIERGRYLVHITGCNDCHTKGFAESGGQVPEDQWLSGGALGFRGPWGTTYASNLRLYFAQLSEDQWVQAARALNTRPPMPWFSVQAMNEPDLRAMYRYVRTLRPLGAPAPAFVPPGREPQGPAVRYPAPPGR
jgi:mono/diheme cytochrome c family protein